MSLRKNNLEEILKQADHVRAGYLEWHTQADQRVKGLRAKFSHLFDEKNSKPRENQNEDETATRI